MTRNLPPRSAGLAGIAGALILSGCLPDLGECDEDLARTVVYRESADPALDGLPAYAGQALLQVSCTGDGGFCHAATPSSRYGAPGDLSFDVRIACADPAMGCSEAELTRLRRAQHDVVDFRYSIVREVQSGQMPPGRAGREVRMASSSYRMGPDPTSAALPEVDTREGRAILKSWLACDDAVAPVVERTIDEMVGLAPGTLCTDSSTAVVGDCVVRAGRTEAVPDPRWSSIFATVIAPRCAESCHGPTLADQLALNQLDLCGPTLPCDADLAYAALCGSAGTGEDCQAVAAQGMGRDGPACGAAGATLILARDPAMSLLIDKLEESPGCGARMPIGGPFLGSAAVDAIRTWITNGAQND